MYIYTTFIIFKYIFIYTIFSILHLGFFKQIENQKLEFKAQSKVGSLNNVKHKPGGGDIKIFDDKDYIKNISGLTSAPTHSGQEVRPNVGLSFCVYFFEFSLFWWWLYFHWN